MPEDKALFAFTNACDRTWRACCFSKIEKMHDIVIGLLINKVEFGRDIHA